MHSVSTPVTPERRQTVIITQHHEDNKKQDMKIVTREYINQIANGKTGKRESKTGKHD